MSKLTPWFPGNVKPVRVGVYERHNGYYSFWNGKRWIVGFVSPEKAERLHFQAPSPFQRLRWRGILKDET